MTRLNSLLYRMPKHPIKTFFQEEPMAQIRAFRPVSRVGCLLQVLLITLIAGTCTIYLAGNARAALAVGITGVTAFMEGVTERVSVTSDGHGGNNMSYIPAISADGRFVTFISIATNLVPGDTNRQADIFVYDRQTEVTERVSIASDGSQNNRGASVPAISADGQFVVFESNSTNLVPDDSNFAGDVFMHDRQTHETTRISVASDGTEGNSWSRLGAISGDGRFVAFDSAASNLGPNDTNNDLDVFVHDRLTGETVQVSINSDGVGGNKASFYPTISLDGNFVAYASDSTNLAPSDTQGDPDIFVFDRQTGQTELVSVASDGTPLSGFWPAISADGRVVAFFSADNKIYIRDRQTGETESIAVEAGAGFPSISGDGRFVAFMSAASLVPEDTNKGLHDIYVYDRQNDQIELVSVNLYDMAGNRFSNFVSLTADGQCAAFGSDASDLIPQDGNNSQDIFVRCRTAPASHVSIFAAEPAADTVTLHWETTREVDLAGFHLYRTPTSGEPSVRMNEDLIPATGSAEAGTSYQLTDQPGSGHFLYELELVRQDGETLRQGQVEVQVENGQADEHQVYLPRLQAR
jgi:Tol biopolymer transport system component